MYIYICIYLCVELYDNVYIHVYAHILSMCQFDVRYLISFALLRSLKAIFSVSGPAGCKAVCIKVHIYSKHERILAPTAIPVMVAVCPWAFIGAPYAPLDALTEYFINSRVQST